MQKPPIKNNKPQGNPIAGNVDDGGNNITAWGLLYKVINNPKILLKSLYVLIPLGIVSFILIKTGNMGYQDGHLWIGKLSNTGTKNVKIEDETFSLIAPSSWVVDNRDTITLRIIPELILATSASEYSGGLYIPTLTSALLKQSRLRLKFVPKDEDATQKYRSCVIDWGDVSKLRHEMKKQNSSGSDSLTYEEITSAEITDDCGRSHKIKPVMFKEISSEKNVSVVLKEKKDEKIYLGSFH